MISPVRLASLHAQAACDYGYAPTTLTRLNKESRPKPDGLGPMIVITLGELRDLLSAYDAVHAPSDS